MASEFVWLWSRETVPPRLKRSPQRWASRAAVARPMACVNKKSARVSIVRFSPGSFPKISFAWSKPFRNKIIKTFQIALLLSLGLLLTGVFVTTPRLILLLLFANDFVTMSLADDRVTFSRKPDRWRIWPLTASALLIAIAWLVLSFAVFLVGRNVFH